ncbi:hypothetical protein DPMN_028340 [Dreissena polymorpha]|uniref:Uncharacterized protein n=1 Tax=Dreissena polymorpha TaxID=45954 RepID=A0A9D4LYT5_DREPO|nr:hypothetical protein DPMN_028340 [Dreissena polymorpha]
MSTDMINEKGYLDKAVCPAGRPCIVLVWVDYLEETLSRTFQMGCKAEIRPLIGRWPESPSEDQNTAWENVKAVMSDKDFVEREVFFQRISRGFTSRVFVSSAENIS